MRGEILASIVWTPVGRKPDFAKPTSRPTSRRVTLQSRAAPKRSDGGSRRVQDVFCRWLYRAGFEPRRAYAIYQEIITNPGFLSAMRRDDPRPTARLKSGADTTISRWHTHGAPRFSPYRSWALRDVVANLSPFTFHLFPPLTSPAAHLLRR